MLHALITPWAKEAESHASPSLVDTAEQSMREGRSAVQFTSEVNVSSRGIELDTKEIHH
jgi:hypothetical protein